MSGHRQQAAAPGHGETDRCGHRDLAEEGYAEGPSNEPSQSVKLYNHGEGFKALCYMRSFMTSVMVTQFHVYITV